MNIDYRQKQVPTGIRVGDNLSLHPNLEDSFNSRFPTIKGLLAGTITYTFSSNPGVGTLNLLIVDHDLGYIPATRVQYKNSADNDYHFLPRIRISGDFIPSIWEVNQGIEYRATSTQLIIRYVRSETGSVPGGSGENMNGKSFDFKFFIFADPG